MSQNETAILKWKQLGYWGNVLTIKLLELIPSLVDIVVIYIITTEKLMPKNIAQDISKHSPKFGTVSPRVLFCNPACTGVKNVLVKVWFSGKSVTTEELMVTIWSTLMKIKNHRAIHLGKNMLQKLVIWFGPQFLVLRQNQSVISVIGNQSLSRNDIWCKFLFQCTSLTVWPDVGVTK